MTLSMEMITVDCTDPQRLAAWWAEAVGGSAVNLPGGDFVVVARENWPGLGFQRVDAPTPGKNRDRSFHRSGEGGMWWTRGSRPSTTSVGTSGGRFFSHRQVRLVSP